MRIFLSLFLLFLAAGAQAAERITLLITITNRPVTGNTLTINSDIRTWTNASTASTILTNLVSTNNATTNLFNQIASYPYAGGIFAQWASSNSIRLVGAFGGALSGLQTGNWASLTFSTQSAAQTFTALWPLENIAAATNRTNQGSSFVYGLSTYSTQAFATNATAVSNLLQKGAGPLQKVAGPVHFTGTNSFSSIGAMTNGYWTNGVLLSPIITNGINYGNAFSSPGTNTSSEQFGTGARARGIQSTALGSSAAADGDYGVAIGTGAASGTNAGSIAIGSSALARYTPDNRHAADGIAIGTSSRVSATNAIAIGSGAISDYQNAIVIGTSATATTTNQIVLGASTHTVVVPGMLSAATQTNSVLRGTNVINGRVDFTSRANTGLANGNNSGVILGTNVYVRLSGATTIGAIAGFAAEQDGSFHVIQFSGAITNLILNDSGVDATAANRIITGTGADLGLTNSPTVIGVIYDATATRWRLFSLFR